MPWFLNYSFIQPNSQQYTLIESFECSRNNMYITQNVSAEDTGVFRAFLFVLHELSECTCVLMHSCGGVGVLSG